MRIQRPMVLAVIMGVVIALSFLIPKPKYESLNVLSQIYIPARMPGWDSIDVSDELNLKDDRYNFISGAIARLYRNVYGEQVLFLILDAGNFHNPKVCYTSTGFTVKELKDATFNAGERSFQAVSLDMQKPQQGTFLFYWICIDKTIRDWTGQKLAELWASLWNKKKAGLMVRMEIPSKGLTPQQAEALGREFIQTLSGSLSDEDKEYLFGR